MPQPTGLTLATNNKFLMTHASIPASSTSARPEGNAVGILHPGEMGAALARVLLSNGNRVCWVGTGRSKETRERAKSSGLEEMGSIEQLCEECPVILSICPPHAALDVARRIAEQMFTGTFVDANAISPVQVRQIENLFVGAAHFVDAAVIGPPPSSSSMTRLFVSGERAESMVHCFSGEGLNVSMLGSETGAASAVKMCDSAVTKGLRALLVATLAAADRLNVSGALEEILRSREATAGYMRNREHTDRRLIEKSWRFVGEMDAISETFRELNLPDDFHRGAGEIYRRLSDLSSYADTVTAEEMMRAVRQDANDITTTGSGDD